MSISSLAGGIRSSLLVLSLLPLAIMLPAQTQAEYNPIELLNIPNEESQTDGTSRAPQIVLSNDGRYVVFESEATNLVDDDENSTGDIFLIDRDADEGSRISRISVDSDEEEGTGASSNPSISADGRYVVFQSDATDLVENDDNNATDIFLRDTTEGTTVRISVDDEGEEADADSQNPRISSDGAYIVYESSATNLVDDDENNAIDIFRYDRVNGTTIRASLDSDEEEGDADSTAPAINSDGSLVVFASLATNLSDDDSDGAKDIFLRDIDGGTTTYISTDSDDGAANGDSSEPFISDDGTLISFTSTASDLITGDDNTKADIFLYTVASGETERVSGDGDGDASRSALSGDNRFVLFQSAAENLVTGDTNLATDIFAYDRNEEEIVRISVGDIGSEILLGGTNPTINANGQYVVYASSDDDITVGDDNGFADLFLTDTQCLLSPTGVTPGDEDSDGTNDCDDECPTDADKTEPGTCGCGTAETDTDSDGTPDCTDECSEDSEKSEEGVCGCGVADSDTNGNGIADCLDFSSTTQPRKPVVFYRKRRRALRVIIPTDIPGFQYQIQVLKGRRTLRKRITRRGNNRLPARRLSGVIRVRYRVILDDGTTPYSRVTRVRIP
jgi:Tol biopolymer transport system component